MTISKTVALPLGYTLMENSTVYQFTYKSVKLKTNNKNKFLKGLTLPTKIKKFAVLRSPTVNKNSFEYFGIKIKKKLIILKLLYTKNQIIQNYIEKKILKFLQNFTGISLVKINIANHF